MVAQWPLFPDEVKCDFGVLALRGVFLDFERHVFAIIGERVRPVARDLIALDHGCPFSLHLVAFDSGFGTHLKRPDLILLHLTIRTQTQIRSHDSEV